MADTKDVKQGKTDEVVRLKVWQKAAMGLGCTALVFLLIEAGMRLIWGMPTGTFNVAFNTARGPYPPNTAEVVSVGPPIPYWVESNPHGFRGPQFRTGLDAPAIRVVAIGDSITDGPCVDNDSTYPHFLGEELAKIGYDAEVINAGFGFSSIGKAFAVLREFAVPLSADVVVLTFVTNDIYGIRDKTAEQLLSVQLKHSAQTWIAGWFVARTAIGEGLLDLVLRIRSPLYRQHERADQKPTMGEDRYEIPGGNNYAENSRSFLRRFAAVDGLLLTDVLEPRVTQLLENYVRTLERFRDVCRENDIELLFVYFPAYPQIYLPDVPAAARDLLRARVEELGIPFLDLAPTFRQASHDGPIHLAPIDYHLNPRGNAVMAAKIAESLTELEMLP